MDDTAHENGPESAGVLRNNAVSFFWNQTACP
jgi:hypothetical protein